MEMQPPRAGTPQRLAGAADEAHPSESWRSAGWIDIQVNGYAGVDLNADNVTTHDLENLTQRLHREGVARWFPTVITAAPTHMTSCLRRIAAARRESPLVARAVLGIHLEGPFLSDDPGARGAHPADHVKDPDDDLYSRFQDAADGLIRIVTLAPERTGAAAFTQRRVDEGLIVAIGHSNASVDAIREVVDAGATLSTHLGNGAPALLPRHPNVIWEQLAEDRLTASAIFDGHHLSKSVMQVLAKTKGPDHLILTSDAVALGGQPPGVYSGQVGGEVELHPSGKLTMVGTPYLAGSASSLREAMQVAIHEVGISPADALRFVAYNPASLVGHAGNDHTTMTVRDGEVHIDEVVIEGEVAYAATSHT